MMKMKKLKLTKTIINAENLFKYELGVFYVFT